MGVSGVILAAGASSRLGRPKQLLRLDGEPVIHVVARNALASKLAEVIVVTGGAADEVEAAVADLP
ncbi:MAG: NTP transferase domain-containing protein, partial [Thermomicrobiales bacterium]|nr:NTP transferase domain-containing protein [Thermomicrobiales bacterium]